MEEGRLHIHFDPAWIVLDESMIGFRMWLECVQAPHSQQER